MVFPQQVAPWILSPESLALLVSVLEGSAEGASGGGGSSGGDGEPPASRPPAPPGLQQPLLEALLRATAEPDCLSGGGASGELVQLRDSVLHIATSGDAGVRPVAARLAEAIDVYL